MAETKHIRTCIGCGRRASKAELSRIVCKPDGSICFDESSCMPGRGAYVCDAACLEKAQGKQRLSRALKTSVSNDEVRMIVSRLKQHVNAAC